MAKEKFIVVNGSLFIVVNGSFRPDDNHASYVGIYDDLDSAVSCCRNNLAEDFGYDSWEDFVKEEFPVCSGSMDTEYTVSYSLMEHDEVYKIYKIKV